jgi:chemotaxis protein MotA
MDIASILGYALAAVVVLYGMGHDRSVFINLEGIVIVFGGTLAGLLLSCSGRQLIDALKAATVMLFPRSLPDEKELISELVHLAEAARRGGIASMRASDKDRFLSFAVKAALEKPDSGHVRRVLEDAMNQQESRHSQLAGVFITMAAMGPLLGLVGTIIGIIQVLRNISNPKVLGPAMATAITATFYGITVSALIATPVANKLRERSARERRLREMVTVGMIDILDGAIPIEVDRHLQAFLETKAAR